jgi:hypothetical protein
MAATTNGVKAPMSLSLASLAVGSIAGGIFVYMFRDKIKHAIGGTNAEEHIARAKMYQRLAYSATRQRSWM